VCLLISKTILNTNSIKVIRLIETRREFLVPLFNPYKLIYYVVAKANTLSHSFHSFGLRK